MRPDSAKGQEISLPLSFVLPGQTGSFPSGARVFFHKERQPQVHYRNFIFEGQSLRQEGEALQNQTGAVQQQEVGMPVFSVLAMVIIILFRNLYFPSFQKYFLSFWNNFEIDFSLQKIGIPPVILSLMVIFLSLLDFLSLSGISRGALAVMQSTELVFYPMMISSFCLFLFALSVRFFPLLFPDLKVLFLLSFLMLAFNFAQFGLQGNSFPQFDMVPGILALFFFCLRSLLLFMVLRKFYRYRSALSLFYICALNLCTSLVFYKVLV